MSARLTLTPFPSVQQVATAHYNALKRNKRDAALRKEQERRAFWHTKWEAAAANSSSEAHKCNSP